MPEVTVRALGPAQIDEVDRVLPLNRLDQYREGQSTYLVAWERNVPVGHALVAWPSDGGLGGAPEIQDVYVKPEHRRRGVASVLTAAAERAALDGGFDRLVLSVSEDNEAARQLYRRAGFVEAGLEPKRMQGTILIRGRPFAVDETLVFLVKRL